MIAKYKALQRLLFLFIVVVRYLSMANTNDYGEQGLNRGSSFHIKKPLDEGVVWGEKAKKWLVRIKKNGIICTMGGHIDKQMA